MGQNVSIRPLSPGDEKNVQRYAADAHIAATSNVPHPYPANGAKQFVARAASDFSSGRRYTFAVSIGESFAGVMTLNAVNRDIGTASLDYWIALPFWNRGIGTAAARLAVKFAFDEVGLRLIQSGCLARNLASARLLERNGFSFVDTIIHDDEGSKFYGEPIRRYELSLTYWQEHKKTNG